jgi:POT family proton-dependent oligopeptide transporter
MERKTLWGHPTGLYILFFTEMWERFSYYGMRAILILYLVARTDDKNPGFGWDDATALELYGWYTMLVYMMGVPGGLLADRVLGQKKSVFLGGLLIIIGHGLLIINDVTAFYAGLATIILGVGALKPNISSMVGGLYKSGDARRDNAFYIFYLGINIGAASAPIIVGYMGEVINWRYGFGLAGLGMALGQIVYVFGQKHLKDVGNFTPTPKRVPGIAATSLTREEKDRIIVLLLSFLIIIVFWMAYEQAGGLMNLFAKQKVDRMVAGLEIPASTLQSLHAIFVILFAGVVAWFWTRWSKAGFESSSLFKMGMGPIIAGAGFLFLVGAALQTQSSPDGKASIYWLFAAYGLHVIGELCLSPIALSFITKLAPLRYVSFIMGGYFMATGLANKLASEVGKQAASAGELAVFAGIAIFCMLFGFLVILLVKKLKKLTHGADDVKRMPAEAE